MVEDYINLTLEERTYVWFTHVRHLEWKNTLIREKEATSVLLQKHLGKRDMPYNLRNITVELYIEFIDSEGERNRLSDTVTLLA